MITEGRAGVDAVEAFNFSPGERAPPILGAGPDGRFFSPDEQAGRPAVLVALGGAAPEAWEADAHPALAALPACRAHGWSLVVLAPQRRLPSSSPLLARDDVRIVHVLDPAALGALAALGEGALVVLDGGGRVVHAGPPPGSADALLAALAPRLARDPPRRIRSAAPVLILPNLIAPADCEALIARFEAAPHAPGRLATAADGAAADRLDTAKKRRRDFELPPGDPDHVRLLRAVALGCAPAIRQAFGAEIAFADRLLLARYDPGGGFARHRDNLAPQTRFRDFAVSLNLNTGAYDGGELVFPEHDDGLYEPPAGGALVFSASLLHEARPVIRGRRYVALTFLSTGRSVEGAAA